MAVPVDEEAEGPRLRLIGRSRMPSKALPPRTAALARRLRRPPKRDSPGWFPAISCAGRRWDRLCGYLLIALAVLIFVYYTFWAVALPFVDPESSIHGYFLPRKYVVIIPSALVVFGIGVLGCLIAFVLLLSSWSVRLQAIERRQNSLLLNHRKLD